MIASEDTIDIPFVCPDCKEVITGKLVAVGTISKYYCKPCADKRICRLCDPPVPHEECTGHSFSKTNVNRFMQDKTFVDGARFELE